MADIKPTITDISNDGSVQQFLWETLTQANANGTPVPMADFADRSVQVVGTFDGATITIQGSNDGATWATLNNAQGTALTFTATGLKQIVEVPKWIRPALTGGTTSDLDVYIIARRGNSLRN